MDKAVTHCLKAMTAEKMVEAPLKEVVAALGTLVELERSQNGGQEHNSDVSASEILQALKTLGAETQKKPRTDDGQPH